jgi:hypothetical protein
MSYAQNLGEDLYRQVDGGLKSILEQIFQQ